MSGAALFQTGKLAQTQGVAFEVPLCVVAASLARHRSGDWGDLTLPDKQDNDTAVKKGLRILSAYPAGVAEVLCPATGGKMSQTYPRFWIITEADRSSTTVLLPDE